jgi:hypothetical protein
MNRFILLLVLAVGAAWVPAMGQETEANGSAIHASITFTLGNDIQQLGRKFVNEAPLLLPGTLNNSQVNIGLPYGIHINAAYQSPKEWGVETGLGFVQRDLRYWTLFKEFNSGQCNYCKSDINVQTFYIPVLFTLEPFQNGPWGVRLKSGFVFNWSGFPDNVFRTSGPASLEPQYKVQVIDIDELTSGMLLITDHALGFGIQTGVELTRDFGSNSRASFGLTYQNQLTESTNLVIFGYDREIDQRTTGYGSNDLRFTSLIFSATYTYKFALKKG